LSKKGLSKSGLYRLLHPYSSQAIFLLWLTAKVKALKKRLELYHKELACVEPLLNGQDLKRLGIPPGPIYGRILEALRDARLEGKVRSRRGEERLARKFLAAKR
jgi:tRNA nucleotidyltransferase (CCA-adding enzyme)